MLSTELLALEERILLYFGLEWWMAGEEWAEFSFMRANEELLPERFFERGEPRGVEEEGEG